MRIVFLYDSFAKTGGVERTLIDKANYLASKGHHVVIVTYEQGLHPFSYDLSSKIEHYDLECRFFTLYKYPLLKRLFFTRRLVRLFRSKWQSFVCNHTPDVVVATVYAQMIMKEVLSVGKICPVIIESHLSYYNHMNVSSPLKHLLSSRLPRLYRRCALFISLTEGDAKCWRKHGINVKKVVNPVTVYPEHIDNRKIEKGRIIAVGRMNNNSKRFDRLIGAFSLIAAKYPTWHIDIYGDGELRNQLEELVVNCNIRSQVVLHHSTRTIYDEYLKSEFSVLSSDYEGFGLVIIEAMSCGLPVVSTDCPFGPSEVIENGKTGLLAMMDAKDLAEKMEWLISHEAERKEMGIHARAAAARYKPDIVMKEWEEVYMSVIKQPN